MNKISSYHEKLDSIKGKTIAIVYIFEGETASGYNHYEAWKSDVISDWLLAIQNLHCLPFILDLRTFVYKAMNHSLPPIDYVVNLNNGAINLSTLGLVPSVCSFLSIPCIPCNTYTNMIGENKLASNLIAYSQQFNIPLDLDISVPDGIFRPINLGSSKGIQRNIPVDLPTQFLYQEFINGIDITTPLLYNPYSESLEVLPTILYLPEQLDKDWFLGDVEKTEHKGYCKVSVQIDSELQNKYINFCKVLSIQTYCRIDSRVKYELGEDIDILLKNRIPSEKVYFLEINPTPTIKEKINFHTSLDNINNNDNIYECMSYFKKYIGNDYSHTAFILSCSILALAKSKH